MLVAPVLGAPNINIGVKNPDFVTHASIASSRRVKIAGVSDSDCVLAIGLFQLQNGQVGMAVDGVEPTFQELVRVHALMTAVLTEMDHRLKLHALTVPGEQ